MAHPHPLAEPLSTALMDPLPPAPGVLVVDLDAVARNYHRMREAAAASECGAVVKADAYGLGLRPVAARLALEGCRTFFVATLAEGEELRRLLPDATVIVLDGACDGTTAALRRAHLTPALNSLEQIQRWRGSGGGRALLHVDTGMARLGLGAADVEVLASMPDRLDGIRVTHVMTHLACADQPSHPLNRVQLERFDALRRRLPEAQTSIGASAGIFLDRSHHGDLVRAGIGLYGGNPFAERPCGVEQVVRLRARIVQVRDVDEATTVGYGATYDARPPCRIAVCGVGYADGYPRALGNRCEASFRGQRVPVIGRVSMDLTCVDVSAVPRDSVNAGDYVDLLGGDISLEEVASVAGTISYEVLTRLGPRVRRVYEGEF